MTALDKLIEAVEAGVIDGRSDPAFERAIYPGEKDMRPVYLASDAYHGSLDAALALHEALLPGWPFTVNENGAWTDERRGLRRLGYKRASESTPARAWLIAILRAYRSVQA